MAKESPRGDAAMAAAQAEAAEPNMAVPDSAPELREVHSAPAGEALVAYEKQSVNADELMKQFLSEISDVARDAEVQRYVAEWRVLERAPVRFVACRRTH